MASLRTLLSNPSSQLINLFSARLIIFHRTLWQNWVFLKSHYFLMSLPWPLVQHLYWTHGGHNLKAAISIVLYPCTMIYSFRPMHVVIYLSGNPNPTVTLIPLRSLRDTFETVMYRPAAHTPRKKECVLTAHSVTHIWSGEVRWGRLGKNQIVYVWKTNFYLHPDKKTS